MAHTANSVALFRGEITLSRGQVKGKLAVLRHRLAFTPEQETAIARALEYGLSKIKAAPPDVMVMKATPEEIQRMDDTVRAPLTADQFQECQSFRAEEQANALEAVASRELPNLQSMSNLRQEQKGISGPSRASIADWSTRDNKKSRSFSKVVVFGVRVWT